jgi:3-hydroxyisobutyrate dehydrogenase
MPPSLLRAGFIGLGNIGKPLASNLAPKGFETIVYDIASEPVAELVKGGARAAATPREVGANANVIGICVPEDDHVRAVMLGEDGLLAGAAPGTVVAIHSTIQPSTAIELGAIAAESQVHVIDACVTGGDARAAEGTVTYLVGGDADVIEKVRPYLDAASTSVVHAGELGCGAKLKLCINVVTYIQWGAAWEGMKLAMASGLSPEVFEEAGRANGQLTELQLRYLIGVKLPPEVRAGESYQRLVRGHMKTAEKDLAWALKLARDSELSMPVSGLVSQLMAKLYGVDDAGRR